MPRRRRRNPTRGAIPLGSIAEYGRSKRARIDARMIATKSGSLTGYLGEDDHKLVMLRPKEITRSHAPPFEVPGWIKVVVGFGAVAGVIYLLGRRA